LVTPLHVSARFLRIFFKEKSSKFGRSTGESEAGEQQFGRPAEELRGKQREELAEYEAEDRSQNGVVEGLQENKFNIENKLFLFKLNLNIFQNQ
jgi:hypothetical protein